MYYANLGTRHHSDLSAVSVLVSLPVERQRGGAEPTNPQSQLSSALPELISAIASLPVCSGFFLAPFAGLSTSAMLYRAVLLSRSTAHAWNDCAFPDVGYSLLRKQ